MNVREYHCELVKCINGEVTGGSTNRRGVLGGYVGETAARLISHHRLWRDAAVALSRPPQCDQQGTERVEIEVRAYDGTNPTVRAMQEYLQDHGLFEDLVGATLHGSLARNDEISYSDFDAMVIIRDTTLSDPDRLFRLAQCLERARSIMHRQDPLQHHGWFALPECMLRDYPDTYLPVATLKESRSLGEPLRTELHVSWSPNVTGFHELADRTFGEIDSQQMLKNVYQLKSTLSKFMLLPALYLHARDGRGVTKRESYELLRSSCDVAMQPMDSVSQIRAEWNVPINAAVQRLSCNTVWRRSVGVKRIAPPVPKPLANRLDGRFRTQMLEFVSELKQALRTPECEVLA